MTKHNYFGQVKKDLQGFSAENTFEIPYFETYNNSKFVKVYLGEEYNEEWKKIETPPTQIQLAEYEKIFRNFLIEIDKVIVDIQEKAFEYYQKFQAKYYEELSISNKEEHFEYMKKILGYIRVLENNTIKIPISYNLDEEHGLELKIVNNKVEKGDGIDET